MALIIGNMQSNILFVLELKHDPDLFFVDYLKLIIVHKMHSVTEDLIRACSNAACNNNKLNEREIMGREKKQLFRIYRCDSVLSANE